MSALALLGASCTTQPKTASTLARPQRVCKVRTTAYTHTEAGGRNNAVGTRLSGKNVMSAASDWSRWPLGTKFRIVGTDDVFKIDDYGSALIGTEHDRPLQNEPVGDEEMGRSLGRYRCSGMGLAQT